jgi:hypothetical protein
MIMWANIGRVIYNVVAIVYGIISLKKRKGLPENRAGCMACGLKVFSGLIFCFFSIKRKVVATAAMSG